MQDSAAKFPNDKDPPCGQGFTLVELLVATAVLSLLLLVLGQFSSMLGNTLALGYGRAERRQDGRALIDFIGQEMRAAALPVDRMVEAGRPGLQMVVNPGSVTDKFCHPHAVFWQAPLANDTSLGNMAVLGYFVRWLPSAGGNPPKANLCRLFINPTQPGGGNTPVPNPNYRIYTRENDWITDAILNEAAPADDPSGYLGLFADDVIAFFVRCLDESGEVIKQGGGETFNSRLGYSGKFKNEAGSWAVRSIAGPALPHSVEISMVILDTRSALQLNDALAQRIQDIAANLGNDLDTNTSPAEKMARQLQGDNTMRRIVQGMSTQSMRIYMENSP